MSGSKPNFKLAEMTRLAALLVPLLVAVQPAHAGMHDDEGAQHEWFEAAKAGNLELLKNLRENPAVDVTRGCALVGQTALVKAAFNGHAEALEWLITETKLDVNGLRALSAHASTPRSNLRVRATAHMLMPPLTCSSHCPLPAPTEGDPEYKQTPLHIAAFRGHRAACEVLLKHGAKANVENNFGKTPAMSARAGKDPELAKILEDHAEVHAKFDHLKEDTKEEL